MSNVQLGYALICMFLLLIPAVFCWALLLRFSERESEKTPTLRNDLIETIRMCRDIWAFTIGFFLKYITIPTLLMYFLLDMDNLYNSYQDCLKFGIFVVLSVLSISISGYLSIPKNKEK